MQNKLAELCLKKGILLDKETFSILSGFEESVVESLIEKIVGLREKFITKKVLINNLDRIESDSKIVEKIKISFGITLEISKEVREETKKLDSFDRSLKVIYSYSTKTKKIEPSDFTKYFRVRFQEMKPILSQRKELENLSAINKIEGLKQGVSVIGIVYSKRITKNKNIMIDLEDLTGRISILINKDKAVYEKAKNILVDDIIGVKGMGSREILFASDIFYPDSFIQERKFLNRDVSAAFISDVHVGSKNFLENNFLKFIKWLNGEEGEESQREEARKIKYLFITGDCVDGVGIFPGQEELLEIKDIKKQYERLAEILSLLRKDINIIMCPGQHDSVRVAEPQPPIGKDYAEKLHELENIIFVSNPSLVEISDGIKGIKILMYHGASMIHFINEIDSLRLAKCHDNPSKVVKEILKRRHLAPCHSFVTYIPYEDSDPLMIREIPDIITTADLHKPDVDIYNNILIVCSSCWQSTTPFEEKVGNHPDPCKVPILNLKTRKIKILDFSGEER